MENVLHQAELLGEAILESDEYIRMRLCEQAALKDERASVLVAEYSQSRTRVEDLLSSNNLDHAELAKAGTELENAEKAMDEYGLLKKMREARAAFTEMMTQVNGLIKFVVTGESDEKEASGCSGSCSSCGGCGHKH